MKFHSFRGGPEGIRTLDLSDANRTLSQLSYKPVFTFPVPCYYTRFPEKCKRNFSVRADISKRKRNYYISYFTYAESVVYY